MSLKGWRVTARGGDPCLAGEAGQGDELRDVTPGSTDGTHLGVPSSVLSGSPPRIDPHAQAVVAAVLRDRWDRVSPPQAGKLQQVRQVEANEVADELLSRLGRCGWQLTREVER